MERIVQVDVGDGVSEEAVTYLLRFDAPFTVEIMKRHWDEAREIAKRNGEYTTQDIQNILKTEYGYIIKPIIPDFLVTD